MSLLQDFDSLKLFIMWLQREMKQKQTAWKHYRQHLLFGNALSENL